MIKLIPVNIADESLLTPEYTGTVQRSLVYGITTLDSENKFNPKGRMSREEAAEQIYNALEYVRIHAPEL